MKLNRGHIAGIVVLVALLVFWGIIYAANVASRRSITCQGLRVEFADGCPFVTGGEVKLCLDKKYGAYVGQRLDSLQLGRMEEVVDGLSGVLSSEAFTTDDGIVSVRITQRTPVARFLSSTGSYYVDETGSRFPLQKNYSANVPVVEGDLSHADTQGWTKSVLGLIDFLKGSSKWANAFEQIHVCTDGDLLLIPREGDERFNIGNPDDLDDKFRRIEDYYRCIKPTKEYKDVSLKYEGQIVCR